jgi:hypothetical protein
LIAELQFDVPRQLQEPSSGIDGDEGDVAREGPACLGDQTPRRKEDVMKIFVAGATGAVGRRLVPLPVQRGHEVVGTTHTAGKKDALRAAGARPVVMDA